MSDGLSASMASRAVDLMTKGFFCASSWLDDSELQALLNVYERHSSKVREHPRGVRQTFAPVPERVQDKIRALLQQVSRETDLRLDRAAPTETLYLCSRRLLDWHQDHESFYFTADHCEPRSGSSPASLPSLCR